MTHYLSRKPEVVECQISNSPWNLTVITCFAVFVCNNKLYYWRETKNNREIKKFDLQAQAFLVSSWMRKTVLWYLIPYESYGSSKVNLIYFVGGNWSKSGHFILVLLCQIQQIPGKILLKEILEISCPHHSWGNLSITITAKPYVISDFLLHSYAI
jgi:hypothetical protein